MKKLKLHVDQPCQENWENMTPSQRGRFCDACQKQVVDFTMMTDREIAQFFKRPSSGSLCGRFLNEQLNRPIEIPKKRIPWVKYFFQITLPAFLVSLKAGAQKPKAKQDTVAANSEWTFGETRRTTALPVPIIPDSIKGIVYDEHGVPIPLAKVCIKDTSVHTVTDTSGHFIMDIDTSLIPVERMSDDSVQLQVTAPGFIDSLINFKSWELNENLVLKLDSFVWIGTTIGFTVPDYHPMILEYPSIYPNPVRTGGTITTGFKSDSNGKLIIKINDMEGREVLSMPVEISKGKNKIPVDTNPNWIRGFYILQLYDPKGKKLFGEKFLIQ